MNKQISIPATLENVSNMVADLESLFARLPMEVRTSITLALQELGVNIVRHAYAGEEGTIEVTLDWTDQQLNVVFKDSASNGFEMPDTVKAPDPFDLPEHGMGLFIIQQAFDEVNYEHLAPGNRWTLNKTL